MKGFLDKMDHYKHMNIITIAIISLLVILILSIFFPLFVINYKMDINIKNYSTINEFSYQIYLFDINKLHKISNSDKYSFGFGIGPIILFFIFFIVILLETRKDIGINWRKYLKTYIIVHLLGIIYFINFITFKYIIMFPEIEKNIEINLNFYVLNILLIIILIMYSYMRLKKDIN